MNECKLCGGELAYSEKEVEFHDGETDSEISVNLCAVWCTECFETLKVRIS